MKLALTLSVVAATLAASVANADTKEISKVDVQVELGDVKNANALEFWPEIDSNLATVFDQKIAPYKADGGYDVTVRVSKISLSGSTILSGKGEFNHLEGWVYVRKPGDPDPVDSFKVITDAKTGRVGVENGMVKLPDMADFYVALLNSFADKSIREIEAQ